MPDWSKEIRSAIAGLNLEPTRESEIIEELSQHLRDRYEELLTSGMDAEQALSSLRRELHDGTLISGLQATVRTAPEPLSIGRDSHESWLAGVWSDLRYGMRLLRVNPGFAIVAILSLALGIGANTTIFQLLDAVRLRTLPVEAPEQLATIHIPKGSARSGDFVSNHADVTSGIWQLIHQQQQGFSDTAAWSQTHLDLGQGGEARYAETLMVSGSFFDVLAVRPVLGRLLSRSDDYRGCGAQGAVISDAFWQREFGGRADVLGRKLSLHGHLFQIMGVTPASFSGIEVGRNFDVAVALCTEPIFNADGPFTDGPSTWWLAIIGRLKPDWTLKQASAQLGSIAPGIFAATLPSAFDAERRKEYLKLHLEAVPAASGVSRLRNQYEDPLWMLLVLSGLVLLIACANLANLMLARASARQREMALRLTLGASRLRLIRQLLAESLLLALLGTVTGVALAQILSRLLVAFLSTQQNHIFMELSPDWRVLAFAAGLAVLTCVLFGLAPAIQASRTDPGTAMKANGRGISTGRAHFLLRRALVVSQVAMSLVLLTGALLFMRTFRNLMTLNAGFQQDHVLIAHIDFSPLSLPVEKRLTYKRELLERMRAISGVSTAADALIVPLSGEGWNNFVNIPNGGTPRGITDFNRVSEGYFQTMETPMLAGRDFRETDTPTSPSVAIVNESFARKFFGGANPVGKNFHDDGKPAQTYQIIGLVKDTKYIDLREEFAPIVFLAASQDKEPGLDMTLVIRSDEPLLPLISSIKQATNNINPEMVLDFSVLKTQIHDGLLRERLMATLSGFFGALATILAMVGLYGVISYMVVRRRNEIGIRMALGASRGNILWMVMGEAAILLGMGLAAGIVLALASGRAASSMLYGLKASDPLTLSIAILGMAVVALLASILPAQRAATVRPMVVLREE